MAFNTDKPHSRRPFCRWIGAST